MELKILGCYGGKAKGYDLTSFLINNRLLVDAGSAADILTVDEQVAVDAVLLTHSHLDHVCSIPFIADNINGKKRQPIEVISHASVIGPFKEHILNDTLWPDFTQIPHTVSPVLQTRTVEAEVENEICGLKVMAVPVSHAVPTFGYIISDGKGAMAFTGDTGPTHKFWEVVNKREDMKFIITEVSYPSRLASLAEISRHLTPALFAKEIKKIKDPTIPVYIYHLKPQYIEETLAELEKLDLPNVHFLKQGDIFTI